MKSAVSLTLIVCLLAWTLPLTAQDQPEAAGPLALAMTREAVRLAAAAWIEGSDDWDAVRQLEDGTPVLVTTQQDRRINGKLAGVSDDRLQVVVGWGRKQALLRDDIREVRIGHRLSVGQHAGLGLLLGAAGGFLVGSAAACDPHVCGGERGLAIAGGLVYGTLMGGIGGFVVGEAVHTRSGRLVYARAKP